MRGACATCDDEEDVYLSTLPLSLEGAGEWGVFISDKFCHVREVIVYTKFPLSYLNIFHRRVSSIFIIVGHSSVRRTWVRGGR
jgi:hypothetical protein